MRAALMERGKIWVESIADPIPRRGEILVKTQACGICGSDLHAARHTEQFVKTSLEAGGAFKLTSFDPVVLGHEFCAEVVDYGPETEHVHSPGTLLCSVPSVRRLPLGYSNDVPGGFAQYMVLSSELAIPVPNGTPAEAAALTEPMAVGFHAVNKAALKGDEAVVVIGAGPVGLAVVASLKARSAAPIIVAEYSPTRRALASAMGADLVVDPSATPVFELAEFRSATSTVVFECVGVPGVIDQIFLGSRFGTRIVVVGVCLEMDQARPLIAINKELTVQYVLGYSVEEFRATLHAIAEGMIDVTPLVTHETGLDGVAQTFEDLAHPDAHGKVLVVPWR